MTVVLASKELAWIRPTGVGHFEVVTPGRAILLKLQF